MKQEFKNTTIVINTPVYCLHLLSKGKGVPVLEIPPVAGRSPVVGENQAKSIANIGKTVFIFELKAATPETCNTSIDDLVYAIHDCYFRIAQITGYSKIRLVCQCQGAWLGAIYTALYPKTVVKYSNTAGPIVTKTSKYNAIETYCSIPGIYNVHEYIVAMNGGIQKGWLQYISFSMLNPQYMFFSRWVKTLSIGYCGNKEAIEKNCHNNNWLNSPYDIGGIWFLAALKFFIENKLYNKTWKVCNRIVDLGQITCPVDFFIGGNDDITGKEQTFGMADLISTPKNQITKTVFGDEVGHTIAFTRKKELDIFNKIYFRK